MATVSKYVTSAHGLMTSDEHHELLRDYFFRYTHIDDADCNPGDDVSAPMTRHSADECERLCTSHHRGCLAYVFEARTGLCWQKTACNRLFEHVGRTLFLVPVSG